MCWCHVTTQLIVLWWRQLGIYLLLQRMKQCLFDLFWPSYDCRPKYVNITRISVKFMFVLFFPAAHFCSDCVDTNKLLSRSEWKCFSLTSRHVKLSEADPVFKKCLDDSCGNLWHTGWASRRVYCLQCKHIWDEGCWLSLQGFSSDLINVHWGGGGGSLSLLLWIWALPCFTRLRPGLQGRMGNSALKSHLETSQKTGVFQLTGKGLPEVRGLW